MFKQSMTGLVAIALLAACQPQTDQYGNVNQGVGGSGITKADIGTVAGAALGGWAGHNIGGGSGQTVATIAGTLIGAGLGRSVGGSLDAGDMAAQNQAAQRALETAPAGQALPWSGSNATGTVTPSGYYQTAGGQYCREYSQTITIDGRTERGYGTACRQPNGTWQIVE
jgi:surface antigen